MPARPLTPAQRDQHRAFLRHLAQSGNAKAAAAAAGANHGTLIRRRKHHPAFAQDWDAALAAAHARLHAAGGPRPAEARGEAGTTVTLRRDGRLQLRRARADAFTRAAEQRFLLALSASANISLSAAAAGVSVAAVNKRKRRNPAFAREMRAALAEGHARLELALLESWSPASGDDATWRDNDPPALPPMTPHQALQLLHLHNRGVRWREATFQRALLPGETGDLRSARLARLYRARLVEQTEDEIASKVLGGAAKRRAGSGAGRETACAPLAPGAAGSIDDAECTPASALPNGGPIALPDLAQVKGWSRSDPAKAAANAGEPLGGAMRNGMTVEARERGLKRARRARER